jgi:hypothetical protein
MTPRELAEELGRSVVRVNGILHELYPRAAGDRYARWQLSAEQVQAVRDRFGRTGVQKAAESGRPAADGSRDAWFWEGNVQARVVGHLAAQGWQVIRVADTSRRERGDDILARRDGRELVVEVKGYPSAGYADPRRFAETKPTPATLQAQHWVADALFKALRLRGLRTDVQVAIAFPRFPRYERLLSEIGGSLHVLGIGVFLVDEDGTVRETADFAASGPING